MTRISNLVIIILSWLYFCLIFCFCFIMMFNTAISAGTRVIHTTLYGSASCCTCRSILKTCALWKHGLTSKNTQSQLTYFCKSNINQTFTNGGGMIILWGGRIATFKEIRHMVDELITFLSIFGPQKLGILTARLNKSLWISTSIQWEGISVLKHVQNLLWEQQLNSNNSWLGITVCGRTCE